MFTVFDKAITAFVVPGVLSLLQTYGITPDTEVSTLITMVVTAGLVWLVPNKPKAK